MPVTARDLIEEQQSLEVVRLLDPVENVLEKMVENDYSQLPVIDTENKPLGMITSDSILRGLNNFGVTIKALKVKDVYVTVRSVKSDEDIFELLRYLDQYGAVLVVDSENRLKGIITPYDTTGYFRRRAEDLMLVEDIENAVKDHIQAAFTDKKTGQLDETALQSAIDDMTNSSEKLNKNLRRAFAKYMELANLPHKVSADWLEEACGFMLERREASRTFEELSLYQYTDLLLHKSRWQSYGVNLGLDAAAMRHLLDGVRKTRNSLAHFNGEITKQQREQLRFSARWFVQNPPVYPASSDTPVEILEINSSNEIMQQSEQGDEYTSRYGPLAAYLSTQSGTIDKLQLTFQQVESIIQGELPASARTHRSWWANDSVSHVQSQQWLEVGWRVARVNITEELVTFSRLWERQKAYIDFFTVFLAELREDATFKVRDVSPMGTSWINILNLAHKQGVYRASLNVAFTQSGQLRIELYIDSGEKEINKRAFDLLYEQRGQIEAAMGESLNWERLDHRRAARIATYTDGTIIMDSAEELAKICLWAVDAAIRFEAAIADHAERVLKSL